MDQRTYIKRFAIWTAIICAAIFALCGICFGKVIEESLFAEIAKWVVVSLGVIGIIIEPLIIVVIAPLCYHIKYDKRKTVTAEPLAEPTFSVTKNNIHIENSCNVLKNDFQGILSLIGRQYPGNEVLANRSVKSMEREWCVHNWCHAHGIAKERTRSVDLNWPQRWWVKAIYAVAGTLLWPFTK